MQHTNDALSKIMQTDYEPTLWNEMQTIRMQSSQEFTPLDVVSLAAMAFITRQQDFGTSDELQAYINESISDFTTRGHLMAFVGKNWEFIKDFSNRAGMKELKAAALRANIDYFGRSLGFAQTPESISKIAIPILDLQEDDTLLDQCAGMGRFLVQACAAHNVKRAVGVEVSTDGMIAGNIRSMLMDGAFEMQQGNVLTQDYQEIGANKVFSDIPMATIFHDGAPLFQRLADYAPDTSLRKSDGYFTLSAILNQSNPGKTVIVGLSGLSFRLGKEGEFRKLLTESKKLETVIALPAGLYASTNASVCLFVFSEGNDHVRMVDATDFGKKERTKTVLSDDDIQTILSAAREDGKYSKQVSIDEIRENEYSWMPNRYLESVHVENGVKLIDAAVTINRGSNINARELDARLSDVPTNFQYIMLQHIDRGHVSDDLPYLKSLDEKDERFLVQKGDLLISRTLPFKIAVMPDTGERKVLSNGNLYYIRLNQQMFDPFYVMMYLNSEAGRQVLGSFVKGVALKSLSRKDLEQVQIPRIPLEEQHALAEKYKELDRELKVLRHQELAIQAKMDHLFEEAD